MDIGSPTVNVCRSPGSGERRFRGVGEEPRGRHAVLDDRAVSVVCRRSIYFVDFFVIRDSGNNY